MISYLAGKIIHKSQKYIIVKVGGIGYQVFLNPVVQTELIAGQELALFIHEQIREDAIDLYGFRSPVELDMFELLLSISGIGPKSALGIMAIATVEDLKETIARGDPSLLTKVSGIGRKTAERVILELREKVCQISVKGEASVSGAVVSGDEIDALMALGYTLAQAREALRRVDPALKDSGERIRQALKTIR